MRSSIVFLLLALVVAGTDPIASAQGLTPGRGGLGLKEPAAEADPHVIRVLRGDYALAAAAAMGDITVQPYRGFRENTRLGVTAPEAYGGITYRLSDRLAGSLELATMESGALASRRYSLAGQLQTAFDASSGMSIGVAYRIYEPDYGLRPSAAPDIQANGYSLVPVRAPGTGLGPSYQLQLHYQYSLTTTFGLVLGRELETFTSGLDSSGTGLRQFSFTGQHWLTPSWALSYDVLSNDPSSLRLQGLRLGVRYRF